MFIKHQKPFYLFAIFVFIRTFQVFVIIQLILMIYIAKNNTFSNGKSIYLILGVINIE